MDKYNYNSVFNNCIEEFLAFKVSLNFSRGSYDSSLKSLDNYAIEQHLTNPILSEKVVDGLILFHKKNITQNGQRARLIAIREFGKYLCFIGKNAYVIDKTQIPKRQQYMPYMFSDLELHSLFMSIDNLPIKQNNSHIIAPVLFRMMYCCAMRPGEPLKLLREDVDIDKRIIHIKDTKRHANRIININEDLFHLFKDFDYRMGTRNWFFCTPDYMQLESYWSYNLFRTSWVNANLGTLTSAPRPYDLRHNAASRILQKWIDEDKDIMAMLPYLQAHMGHRHINDTLYYVHLLPEHILKSQNIDWSRFNDLYQGKLYE